MLTWLRVDILSILANKTAKQIFTRWVRQPPRVTDLRLDRKWIVVMNAIFVLVWESKHVGE